MKLTTARLKKLIREELSRMNENASDVINFSRSGGFTWKTQSSEATRYGVKRALGDIQTNNSIWTMQVRFETKNGFNDNPLFEISGGPIIKQIGSTKIVPFLDKYIDEYYKLPRNKGKGREATESSNLTSRSSGGGRKVHVFWVKDQDVQPFLDRNEK